MARSGSAGARWRPVEPLVVEPTAPEDMVMAQRPAVGSLEEAGALALAQASSPRAMLVGSGPRFARDAFGPLVAFVVGWKLFGLVAGIVLSTVVSLVAWRWERRNERPGVMARVALGMVLIQALVGIIANDARVFLAQPVLLNAIYGIAFLVS